MFLPEVKRKLVTALLALLSLMVTLTKIVYLRTNKRMKCDLKVL